MSGRTLLRQYNAIRKSDTYDDTLAAGATLESGAARLEDDLNSLRSQVKRILGTSDWYTDVNSRDLKEVDDELAELEAQTLLARVQVLTDITVPNGQNFKVLSVAGSEAPSLAAAVAGSALGAVVAQSALSGAGFAAHELIEVAGPNAISPKNLLVVRDASTGDKVQSSLRDVFALLQYESTGADGGAFNDTSAGNRVKVSFVRMNAGLDDLEAVPVADIEDKAVNYSYVRRINLDALPEEAFLSDSAFIDQVAAVDITLDRALDNQGATPATADTDITIQFADSKSFEIEGPGGTDLLFAITSDSVLADTVGTINVGTLDIDAIDADFQYGINVATGDVEIEIGMVSGYINSTGADDLGIRAAGELYLDDGNQTGSTWAQTAGIKLSDSTAEWDDFEATFGEVSLLASIIEARDASSRARYSALVTGAIAADTNVTGAGGSPNLDAQLGDYSGVTFVSAVDVYVDGQLMENGADASANNDVYPGTAPADGDLKFEFPLVSGSRITMVIWGAGV